ncbi:MAG: 50S ribosomal protein L15 [Candidatus Buchananbacteria bacterium]|nr:50S ribosomal protein L15 [Candidatus Buchananbacteria bacterium]
MALGLHNLKKTKGSTKTVKRLGRGNASSGNFSGRGNKGQRSRAGGKGGLKRKGLQGMLRNKPKIDGFKSLKSKKETINLGQLENSFTTGELVNAKKMMQKNLIKTVAFGVKVLGDGKLTKKLTVIADAFSDTAKEAIVKAGGQAQVKIKKLEGKKPTQIKAKKK